MSEPNQLLYFAGRQSESQLIETIWQCQSLQAGEFISTAESHSELVVTRYQGKISVTLRGPETRSTIAAFPAGAEFFGIVFRLGTFLPELLPRNMIDRRDLHFPNASCGTFWLDSSEWEIPTFENADVFIHRLIRKGILAHDSVVQAALHGHQQAYSPRTLQYRFVRATGLPYKTIQQIQRAQQAHTLLQQGRSISETTDQLGYFDQAHLTNALKRFLGQTPAQIIRLQQPT